MYEDEEKKSSNKRRTRQEPTDDEMAKRLMADYSSKPRLLPNEDVQMMHIHGESALGVQKGLEAVLRHRRQNGEPMRSTLKAVEDAAMSPAMEASAGNEKLRKGDYNTEMDVMV